ncbi:MAG: hypothetical protein OXG78_03615 [Chloroflexi bacterium]|nr:hypothetical protein [Chloroflexota bacterium]
MLRSAIVVLTLFSIIISRAQDIAPWCRTTCRASDPFSSNNVLDIRTTPVDGGIAREIKWHESEFIVAMLTERFAERHLVKVEFGPKESFIEDYFGITRYKVLKREKSFRQLELLSDMIVVGTSVGTLMFWDLWREEFLYELPVGEGGISELLAHPSGDWLLVVVDHSKLFRFDLASQIVTEVQLQSTNMSTLSTITFSGNGDLLAAAGTGFIGIWDTEFWQALATSDRPSKPTKKLLFAEDDSQLIVLLEATISRWSLSENTLNFVRQLEPYASKRECDINDGEISLDGTLLVTTDDCSQFRAWDLAADAEINIPHLGSASEDYQGTELQFSPDGRYLLVADIRISGEYGGTWGLYIVEDQS